MQKARKTEEKKRNNMGKRNYQLMDFKDRKSHRYESTHLSSRIVFSGPWWCMFLIPALGRQRQKDLFVRGQPGLQREFRKVKVTQRNPVSERKNKE